MSDVGVRNGYAQYGVEKYYETHKNDYRNPHEHIVKKLIHRMQKRGIVGERVLDLCCGSGEVTMALKGCDVIGVDPYTANAYYNRTGKEVIPLSFKDIARGKLTGEFDSVICSFALHLCPNSLLPMVLWRLGEITSTLIVITPHKRPYCDTIYGWILVEEILSNRVRLRVYYR